MSRGPGRIMRAVLENLYEDAGRRSHDRENWHPAYVIAWCIARESLKVDGRAPEPWAVSVSTSLEESVRRAVRALERDGRVETAQRWYVDRDTYRRWSGLHCRLATGEYEHISVGEPPNTYEAGALTAKLQAALAGGAP